MSLDIWTILLVVIRITALCSWSPVVYVSIILMLLSLDSILRVYVKTCAAGALVPVFVFVLVEFRIIGFVGKSFAAMAAFENVLGAII
jgi:hypothetical protein